MHAKLGRIQMPCRRGKEEFFRAARHRWASQHLSVILYRKMRELPTENRCALVWHFLFIFRFFRRGSTYTRHLSFPSVLVTSPHSFVRFFHFGVVHRPQSKVCQMSRNEECRVFALSNAKYANGRRASPTHFDARGNPPKQDYIRRSRFFFLVFFFFFPLSVLVAAHSHNELSRDYRG